MSTAQNAIVQEFLVESFDNLSNISEDLTKYEKNPSDNELLNSIYRKIHTLKGSASFLGFVQLQEITHSVESILDYIRDGALSINSEFIDLFLESFDFCLLILKEVEANGSEGNHKNTELANKLNKVLEASLLKGESTIKEELVIDDTRPSSTLSAVENQNREAKESGEEVSEIESALTELNSEIDEDIVLKTMKEDIVESIANNNSAPQEKRSHVSDSIVKVNVNLLDKIMNVVGELVITRNQILQYSKLKDSADLNRYAQQLNVITTELQTDIMTTRMQPVGSVFTKFERIVRDLSRSQKKKVNLEITGQDTELDKTLIEVIKDPMTHLIRNSLDHGLELPEVREKSGKNPHGLLSIKAYHEGGQVIIEIGDDGAGISAERVKAKAIEKKIITPEEAASMSSQKLHSLIFHPGFSTAEKVTNISGRGVGMDVVKSNIEKIGGEVEVISAEGKGTSFRLKIPLTLAIVPALVIESAGETFAIHQKNLVELVLLEQEDFGKIENLHGKEFFRLRGDLIPIVRLNSVLKLEEKEIDESHHFLNIIVLKAEGKTYGLIVDDILDTQEIVVKPMDRKLKNIGYYAGATIMGDGRVALIIDAFGFYNQVDSKDAGEKDSHSDLMGSSQVSDYESLEVVLFTLGDNRVYGIPLSLISRLEEFDPGIIEWSGEQALVRYRGSSMPLVNVENLLSLRGKSRIEKPEDRKINCIVANINGISFGFVVNEIMDIALTESSIETETIDRDGLLGTVYINEKLISLLDLYKLVSKTDVGKKVFGESSNIKLKGKVLVVEDSPLYRRVHQDFLAEAGLEVVMANNGREGLEALEKCKDFMAIITDVEMPLLDGFEFSEEVRALGINLPIIAVTTRVSPVDLEHGIKVGFNYHLEKLNKQEVLETLSKCL